MKKDAPTCSKELFETGNSGTWTLLWCTAHDRTCLAEKSRRAEVSEYGKTEVLVDKTELQVVRKMYPRRLSAG